MIEKIRENLEELKRLNEERWKMDKIEYIVIMVTLLVYNVLIWVAVAV